MKTMKGMGVLCLSLSILLGVGLSSAHAQDVLNASPVVQVMTYTKVQGKYLQSLGWGSASVISKQGYLLTNNHVVLDGQGKVAAEFSVCMTEELNKTPKCDYTATLVGRDETMDLAVLKIDPQTVYGTQVDYSRLKTIDVDYDYVPQAQDSVLLIGYPWIGSDTITETKGIVSGVATYNDFQYIKTDATIAGGNSGGAMINDKGRLIGVPTYSVGGFFDSSLGYALSIGQAKIFVEKMIATALPSIDYTERLLPGEKKKMAKIKTEGKVDDELMSIQFGAQYDVDTYIENTVLSLKSTGQKDNAEQISIMREQTPELKMEEDYLNYLQLRSVYNTEYEKPLKTVIAGQTCFNFVSKNDTVGDNVPGKTYFCKVGTSMHVVVTTYVMTASSDEKLLKAGQDRITQVLNTLSIKSVYAETLKNRPLFEVKDPVIRVKSGSGTIFFDQQDMVLELFGSLKEYAMLTYTQNYTKETKDIYKNETEYIPDHHKGEVMFQGKKGYVVCNEPYFSSGYAFLGGYIPVAPGSALPTREMTSCTINIYEGITNIEGDRFTVSVSVYGYKDTMKELLEKTYTFMKDQVVLSKNGEGETSLKNILQYTPVMMSYKDLGKQSEGYKTKVKALLSLGILKNAEYFYPEYPMKWKDAVPMYIQAVFYKDIMKDAPSCTPSDKLCGLLSAETMIGEKKIRWKTLLVDKMGLNLNDYVESQSYTEYMKLLYLLVAGVQIGEFTEEEMEEFYSSQYPSSPNAAKWQTEWTKIADLQKLLYGDKVQISYDFTGYYVDMSGGDGYKNKESFFYNPTKGIFKEQSDSAEKSKLPYMGHLKKNMGKGTDVEKSVKDYEESRDLDANTLKCLKSNKNVVPCLSHYIKKTLEQYQKNDSTRWDPRTYQVVTKGEMVDLIARVFANDYFAGEVQKVR